MSDKITCCGAFEQLIEDGFKHPFNRPISVNWGQSPQLQCKGWAVEMHKDTKSGNITKSGMSQVYLNFCPFCGAKLVED